MSQRMRVEQRLRVRNISRLELRAQNAGEWILNLTGSERDADAASRGVLRQAWKAIHIEGVDPASGQVRERAVYRIDWSHDHQLITSVEDDDGKSMIERTDRGLGELVRRTAERMRRKGLRPEVVFYWADGIGEDRRDALRRELGVAPTYERLWEDGCEPRRPTARLTPAKDPGSSFELWWGRRR